MSTAPNGTSAGSALPNAKQSNGDALGGLALAVPPALVDVIAERVAELLAERQERRERPWLDVDGAAAYLACPRSRIYALASARRIPVHRDGSRLLFRPEELDAWVKAGGGRRT